MDSQLTKILATTRRGVEERKAASSTRLLEQAAAAHQLRGFARALRQKAAGGPAVIAELKKASPSRGLIRPDFDVATLAAGLAGGGAAALSVLTEEHFFQGSLRNLEVASQSCDLPCLRKDFLLDEVQLRALAAQAHALELDVLCEVHTGEELDRVLALDCDAIGVNNRDLTTFSVRLQVSLDLAGRLPSAAVHVSESGIETAEDLNQLRAAGFDAFLIGESLMRQPDPGRALEALLAAVTHRSPVSK
jgi:indole-3-glycerol phosphate synthase